MHRVNLKFLSLLRFKNRTTTARAKANLTPEES